ncbi:DUF3810 domain-containing protein [Pedobacter yulinensis]|uniref:DUF3810 domain-containing protein n=1 Tax=Pedobacter yulinensis TaxID=2126353 RepID=A0A2T3HH32_9SPHI|nr:DUF3810 domain-containing protein [Pedobacter yulinensis]PST81747.1 DUF3810 domain-containing protein [Pedobacter yulinensis]
MTRSTARRTGLRQLIVLIILAALVYCWGLSASAVDRWYVGGIYPGIALALRTISAPVPFSLGDLLYAGLIAWLIFSLVRAALKLVRNRSRETFEKFGLALLRTLLILYLAFKLLWGLNYNRQPAYRALGLNDAAYSREQLFLLGQFILQKTNDTKQAAVSMPQLSKTELLTGAVSAYRQMEERNALFRYERPSVKAVTSSWLTSMAGIEGYYIPLTGEANINTGIPGFALPFVTCHEIAHQTGIAYEDEANLLGYLTAVNSADARFRYAAYYQALRYILLEMALRSDPAYLKLKARISPAVRADFTLERNFWQQYDSSVSSYMSATFDRFLKLNDQEKGIKSYQDIVVWLWNIYGPLLQKEHRKSIKPRA